MLYGPMAVAILYLVGGLNIYQNLLGGVLSTVGKVSLEVYLIHVMVLHPFVYYGIIECIGALTYVVIPLLTIPLAILACKIEELIKMRFVS